MKCKSLKPDRINKIELTHHYFKEDIYFISNPVIQNLLFPMKTAFVCIRKDRF